MAIKRKMRSETTIVVNEEDALGTYAKLSPPQFGTKGDCWYANAAVIVSGQGEREARNRLAVRLRELADAVDPEKM